MMVTTSKKSSEDGKLRCVYDLTSKCRTTPPSTLQKPVDLIAPTPDHMDVICIRLCYSLLKLILLISIVFRFLCTLRGSSFLLRYPGLLSQVSCHPPHCLDFDILFTVDGIITPCVLSLKG